MFSRRWVWRCLSSALYRRVDCYEFTDSHLQKLEFNKRREVQVTDVTISFSRRALFHVDINKCQIVTSERVTDYATMYGAVPLCLTRSVASLLFPSCSHRSNRFIFTVPSPDVSGKQTSSSWFKHRHQVKTPTIPLVSRLQIRRVQEFCTTSSLSIMQQ
jgi:hypothetical protein